MKDFLLFVTGIGAAVLLSQLTVAQTDDVVILDDSISFDADFSFDDNIFAGAFDQEPESSSWLDPFTVKITQQLFGQSNNHSVDLAPGFTFQRESALINNRLGVNIDYQNPFAPGWLFQASGQIRVYWNDDYEFENNDDTIDTEYRLGELFLQRSIGNHSFKLGRQTVVWGETVGNSVLDVINITEARDFTVIDIEDARLNQWMLSWDYYGNSSSTLSTFINLYPDFNPPPVRGSTFFFEPQFNITEYVRDETLFEVGTQWRKSFEGTDIALMAAYLYENQLRHDDPVSGMGDANPRKNDYTLLGFSISRAIGLLLLSFDFAYNHDVLLGTTAGVISNTSTGPTSDIKKDRVGVSLGFDYAITNYQSISVGLSARKYIDETEGLTSGQTVTNEGVFGNALVRYSNTLLNDDLVLSGTVQTDLDADSLLIQAGANYTVNDYWAMGVQIVSLSANKDSPLFFFNEDLYLGATLTYTF